MTKGCTLKYKPQRKFKQGYPEINSQTMHIMIFSCNRRTVIEENKSYKADKNI